MHNFIAEIISGGESLVSLIYSIPVELPVLHAEPAILNVSN